MVMLTKTVLVPQALHYILAHTSAIVLLSEVLSTAKPLLLPPFSVLTWPTTVASDCSEQQEMIYLITDLPLPTTVRLIRG
jgi:hypothetical protein